MNVFISASVYDSVIKLLHVRLAGIVGAINLYSTRPAVVNPSPGYFCTGHQK